MTPNLTGRVGTFLPDPWCKSSAWPWSEISLVWCHWGTHPWFASERSSSQNCWQRPQKFVWILLVFSSQIPACQSFVGSMSAVIGTVAIFPCYCKNISFWKGVEVLQQNSQGSFFWSKCYSVKNVYLEYCTLPAYKVKEGLDQFPPLKKNISLWEGELNSWHWKWLIEVTESGWASCLLGGYVLLGNGRESQSVWGPCGINKTQNQLLLY